jgi:GntR family transcriptional regulator, transcriptional repressor for pyruvate dehydrogenase complex
LRPGDPIGTQCERVRQFGVNRSTVREASAGSNNRASWRVRRGRLLVAVPHDHPMTTRMSRALMLEQVT